MSSLTRRFRRQNGAGIAANPIPYLEPLPAPRWNQYTCAKCNHSIFTVEFVDGTTPMQVRCTRTAPLEDSKRPNVKESRCHGLMLSKFYPAHLQDGRAAIDADGKPKGPDFIWRQPTLAELRSMNHGLKEHVRLGGLLDYVPNAVEVGPGKTIDVLGFSQALQEEVASRAPAERLQSSGDASMTIADEKQPGGTDTMPSFASSEITDGTATPTPSEQATMNKTGLSLADLQAITDNARVAAGVGISTRPDVESTEVFSHPDMPPLHPSHPKPNVNLDRASVRATNGPQP